MSKITYDFHEYRDDGTLVELEFVEDDDIMDCNRFHDFCKRFAIAIGYSSNTVERVFGETKDNSYC